MKNPLFCPISAKSFTKVPASGSSRLVDSLANPAASEECARFCGSKLEYGLNRKVVRRVGAIQRFLKDLARLEMKGPTIENPVDVAASGFSCEAMKSAGIRLLEGRFEIQPPFAMSLLARQPLVTLAIGCRIKIAHDNCGNLSREGGELFLNHSGRPHLGRGLKIKVSVNTYQGPVINMEKSEGALPWELASKGTTWDTGRLT